MPLNSCSAPIGSWMRTGGDGAELLLEGVTQKSKSAPSLSILLTKSDARDVVLVGLAPDGFDCGSTPWLPSSTAIAPSSTRSERSTSMVKSTWPGVSMMLNRVCGRCGLPEVVVAAELIVMPRFCSSSTVHGGGAFMDFADLVANCRCSRERSEAVVLPASM